MFVWGYYSSVFTHSCKKILWSNTPNLEKDYCDFKDLVALKLESPPHHPWNLHRLTLCNLA